MAVTVKETGEHLFLVYLTLLEYEQLVHVSKQYNKSLSAMLEHIIREGISDRW